MQGLSRPQRLERLAGALFPEAPRAPLTRMGGAAAVLFVIAGSIICLARQSGAGALNTLYAEDGSVFLSQGLRYSAVHALRTPYVGYFHLVPRLATDVTLAFPLADAATAFAVEGAVAVALIALFVFRATAGHIRSPLLRLVLASSLVLLPVDQQELFNAVANIHWFLLFAATWALLWHPSGRGDRALAAAVVVIAALSDPLTILLAPLAVLRLIVLPDWRRQWVSMALLSALAVQLVGSRLVHARRNDIAVTTNVVKLAGWYIVYVIGRAGFGMRWVESGHGAVQLALVGVAALMALALLVTAARRSSLPVTICLVVLSGLFFLLPVGLTDVAPPRYSVTPILLLLSAAVYLFGQAEWSPQVRRATALSVCTLLVVVWAANYRVPNQRGHGPSWSTTLSDAKAECATQARARLLSLPITPRGWAVTVTCAQVASPASGVAVHRQGQSPTGG